MVGSVTFVIWPASISDFGLQEQWSLFETSDNGTTQDWS